MQLQQPQISLFAKNVRR